jgi:hypothetical protein
MKKVAKTRLTLISMSILSSALIGCSGHPGAGQWQSMIHQDKQQLLSQYAAFDVAFDGKGTLQPNQLHAQQEGKDDLWCVWQARSATALEVNCGDGSENKTNIKFELVVTGEKQTGAFAYTQAKLLHSGEVVAQFERKL